MLIGKKSEQLNQLVEPGKTLEVVKCWDVKTNAGDIQLKKLLSNVHRVFAHVL